MASSTRLTLKPSKGDTASGGFVEPSSTARPTIIPAVLAQPPARIEPAKPSQAESRRDRVAINVFQALISRFATTDTTRAKLLAGLAFDYTDAFLEVREQRGAQ